MNEEQNHSQRGALVYCVDRAVLAAAYMFHHVIKIMALVITRTTYRVRSCHGRMGRTSSYHSNRILILLSSLLRPAPAVLIATMLAWVIPLRSISLHTSKFDPTSSFAKPLASKPSSAAACIPRRPISYKCTCLSYSLRWVAIGRNSTLLILLTLLSHWINIASSVSFNARNYRHPHLKLVTPLTVQKASLCHLRSFDSRLLGWNLTPPTGRTPWTQ